MIILGLTGSVASGKTFALNMFKKFGARIHSADTAVHNIFITDRVVKSLILARFPSVKGVRGEIDRNKLAACVYKSPADLLWLETLIHPKVRESQRQYMQQCRRHRAHMIVLEIPLLFESGANRNLNYIATTIAPCFLRKKRAEQRPYMTEIKWQKINARQVSNFKRRALSHILIHAGLGRAVGSRSIVKALCRCRNKKSRTLFTDLPRVSSLIER